MELTNHNAFIAIFHTCISGLDLFLQGLIFLSLIPNSTHLEQRHYRSILVDGANVHESHSILNHESNSFVGFHEEDEDPMSLGIAKENSGFFSRLTISWVNSLMLKGSCGYLRYPDDLFELPPALSTSNVSAKFQETCSGTGGNTSSKFPLVKTLHSNFGWEFYSIGILRLLADVCGFAGPILLNLLVSFIEGGDETKDEWRGYFYVLGMFSASFAGNFAQIHLKASIVCH
jgi:ATP-binding cassette subfamily C (CFTR/MRP) protein 10